MPPPEDEEGDDDEGRFFGGGITSQQREILDYVDGADAQIPAEQTIDTAWLRKTALNLEKLITRNAEQRARFAGDPAKFIQSEADLDGAVKGLGVLAEHADLYPELARLGSAGSVVGLLAHDNSDISVDVLELLNELMDEDVEATEEQWNALVDAAVDADLLGLLASNLERLDETEEVDRNGVYYALGILESLCSRAATAEAVGATEPLVGWLLKRAAAKEQPVGQNKQYAAEVLAILVQASPRNRQRLADRDAVDALLQLAAAYRRRDPERGGDEEEYMENLFEALTCLADAAAGKTKLVEAEGVELCLLMLKEGKLSKPAALRLLDHAAGGGPPDAAAAVCERIVEAGGLKPLFTLFMKTTAPNNQQNKSKKDDASATAEHLVGLFASLLRRLPGDSAARIRTLAKFVEKDYEKTARLVTLRRKHASRVAAADAAIEAEKAALDEEDREERADVWFSRRLDAGLFALQTADVVLAWLAAEDAGARSTIARLLAERDESLAVVRASVLEQRDAIEAADDDEDAADTREMLSTLAEFLR